MSRRFAGTSTYALRTRRKLLLVICSLSTVVMTLFTFVTYLLFSTETQDTTKQIQQEDISLARPELVDVLVAAVRIESGTRVDASMFNLYAYEKDRVPFGVLHAGHEQLASGKYAKRMIRAGFPITQEDLSDSMRLDFLHIPPGYRAVAIFGTQTELVNGYVTPNSRVDVLFHYNDERGRDAVKTLVPFVKVLSVDGVRTPSGKKNVSGGATATLLVTIRDAQRIELARRMGQLTLALRGVDSNGTEATPDSPVTPCDVMNDCGKIEITDPDGTMLIPGRDGRLIKYILEGNKWRRVHEREEEV